MHAGLKCCRDLVLGLGHKDFEVARRVRNFFYIRIVNYFFTMQVGTDVKDYVVVKVRTLLC